MQQQVPFPQAKCRYQAVDHLAHCEPSLPQLPEMPGSRDRQFDAAGFEYLEMAVWVYPSIVESVRIRTSKITALKPF
jgi:hypothetical protein